MKNHWGMTRLAVGLAGLIAMVASGSAQAATSAQTSACSTPSYSFSQPYLTSKDSNWYTLAPGQSADNFDGTGWVLSGGARLVTTTLADGTTGTVLELPAGSKAVSPPMCVDSLYPTARLSVRDVLGPPGLQMYAAYTNTPSWTQPTPTNPLPGSSAWSTSPPMQLHPGDLYGWQDAQYTFENNKKGTEAQLYDFYVDPRCRL